MYLSTPLWKWCTGISVIIISLLLLLSEKNVRAKARKKQAAHALYSAIRHVDDFLPSRPSVFSSNDQRRSFTKQSNNCSTNTTGILSTAYETSDSHSNSSSYSQVVLIYFYPFWRNSLLKSTPQPQIAKKTLNPLF